MGGEDDDVDDGRDVTGSRCVQLCFMGCTEDKHGGCRSSFELRTAEYEAGLLIATPRGSMYTENDWTELLYMQ
jgi:hypothetical protein